MTAVSVIIPCHDCRNWVGRAIESVIRQSHKVSELLLIENNSTDDTLQVLKQYGERFPDIITVYSITEVGACAARNFGLSKAAGEWIQFLDADDEILPDKIKDQLALADTHHADVIASDYLKVFTHPDRVYKVTIKSSDDPWIGLIDSTLGITSANLWKRESLLEVKGLDKELSSSQEYDLMFRMLKHGCRFVVTHSVLTYIHKQNESISRTDDPLKKAQILFSRYQLRLRILNYLQENPHLFFHAYRQEIYKRLFLLLMQIKEHNELMFQNQLHLINFKPLYFSSKLKAYYDYICSSSKLKYNRENFALRHLERYFYLVKQLYLLKY